MPPIHPTHVVSFSSEDPAHPASNLLKGDTFRKWKCKEGGTKSEFVILQLDKAMCISNLDIGNESSAFVEVLVGRSGQTPQVFEVLVNSCAMMSPGESRNNTNFNRVKMFSTDKLNKPVASEKWDLVKVVCQQDFNTHIQYGIAFINLHSAPDPNDKPKIGGFTVRSTALGDADVVPNLSVGVGSLFAKRQLSKGDSPSKSPAAAIRGASLTLASAAISSSEERMKEIKKRKLDTKDVEEEDGSGGSQSSKRSRSPLLSRKKPEDVRRKKGDQISSLTVSSTKKSSQSQSRRGWNSDEDEVEEDDDSESKSRQSSNKKPKPSTPTASSSKQKPRKRKPFHKLFDGVVFVMSGFQNPERSILRKKAVEMGARCKPDWDNTCTHLLCAFVNTPKFREVRRSGQGNIVKKEWIDASYRAKCRFPWRRYCLDRDDKGQDESEDEIYALDDEDDDEDDEQVQHKCPGQGTKKEELGESSSSANGKRNSTRDDDGSPAKKTTRDTDERPKGKISPHDDVVKRKRVLVLDSSDEENGEEKKGSVPTLADKEEMKGNGRESMRKDRDDDSDTASESYFVDTDVDEDSGKTSSAPVKSSNDGSNDFFDGLFDGICFYLYHIPEQSPSLMNEDQRDNLKQIIRRHKGRIETDCLERAEYILVTDGVLWCEDFAEALSENPNAKVCRMEWVIQCDKEKEMIPDQDFLVLPEI